MNVVGAWLLYILVALGVFVLLSLCTMKLRFDMTTRIFIATVISLIVLLFAIPHITPASSGERTWYSILLIVAILLPLAIAIWFIWTHNRDQLAYIFGMGDGNHKHYECVGDSCRLKTETRRNGGTRETFEYK